jgi:hypothetical protein
VSFGSKTFIRLGIIVVGLYAAQAISARLGIPRWILGVTVGLAFAGMTVWNLRPMWKMSKYMLMLGKEHAADVREFFTAFACLAGLGLFTDAVIGYLIGWEVPSMYNWAGLGIILGSWFGRVKVNQWVMKVAQRHAVFLGTQRKLDEDAGKAG